MRGLLKIASVACVLLVGGSLFAAEPEADIQVEGKSVEKPLVLEYARVDRVFAAFERWKSLFPSGRLAWKLYGKPTGATERYALVCDSEDPACTESYTFDPRTQLAELPRLQQWQAGGLFSKGTLFVLNQNRQRGLQVQPLVALPSNGQALRYGQLQLLCQLRLAFSDKSRPLDERCDQYTVRGAYTTAYVLLGDDKVPLSIGGSGVAIPMDKNWPADSVVVLEPRST